MGTELAGFTIFNLFLSIVLIWILGRFEPAIHHLIFPSLLDAKNQIYMIGLAVFFGFQIILYPILKTTTVKQLRIQHKSILWAFFIIDLLALVLTTFTYLLILNLKNTQDAWQLTDLYHIENLSIWNFVITGLVLITFIYLLVIKINWTKSLKFSWHFIAIFVILWTTLGFETINLYDYSNYAGPINDFILGKPLLNFRASYGFMPIFLLGIIFHFIPPTSEYLQTAIAIFNAIGFLLVYIILVSVFKDFRWALFTTLFAIFGQHLIGWIAPYQIPKKTFIRMGI